MRSAEVKVRRQQQRADAKLLTRNTLLDAGLDAVIDHGLDVGLDAICARAGYTRGAFYVHFKNREDFLLSLAERILDAIVETVLNVHGEGELASTVSYFSDVLDAGSWPLVPRIRVAIVRLIDATERWPTIRAAFDRFLAVAVERLTRGASQDQTAGRVRRDIETRELATLLVTLGIGSIVLANTSVHPTRQEQRAALLSMISSAQPGAKE
jgi:TetR/AcrR family transcriptional regulator, transcriptional repressor for nem operon